MFVEIALSFGMCQPPEWDFKGEIRKDIPKYCRSEFEEIEEQEQKREMERERLFRLLLEEVQKNN